MKRSMLLTSLVMTGLIMSAFRLAPGTLSAGERKYALEFYARTRARLLGDLKGLTENQLYWKADSSRWSIYQCTEHIALAENLIWQWCRMTEHQPATPEKRSEVKATTDQLVKAMLDRTHKFNAPEMLKPEAKFPDTRAAISAFTLRRDSTMEYIRTTQDDLKDHFVTHPVFGTIDLYQNLVLLAAHSERHTLQIEEVMADPRFPKR
ncbi:MAG TPA: DinB family protein [Puia sp.]|nr:DinB family protein [Puia sp.]